MSLDVRAVKDFLYREARLMDSHAYDEWLALWTDDAHYWVPANDDDYDPRTHISLVNENKTGLEDRITRLKGGAHYAQDPKSRLSRVVSNVEVEPGQNGEIVVHSTFNLTASRRGRIDIFAGRVTHKLRPSGGGFRIASKRVLLVNNDEVINNLTFLI